MRAFGAPRQVGPVGVIGISLFIVVTGLFFLAADRESRADQPPPAPVVHASPADPPQAIRVVDDVCAIRVLIEASTSDDLHRPLGGVELWLRDDYKSPAGTKGAALVGQSSEGLVFSTTCLLEARAFAKWTPGPRTRLAFFATREGYGLGATVYDVETAEFLAEANTLGVPPGKPIDWTRVKPSRRVHRIQLSVSLPRIPPTTDSGTGIPKTSESP